MSHIHGSDHPLLSRMPTIADIHQLVKNIMQLANALPPSIPKVTTKDKIQQVIHGPEGETPFKTFNKWYDALFGEDCHDSAGHLHHICQGRSGMGIICAYLKKLDWVQGFPLDLVNIKLQQLNKELLSIMYVISYVLVHSSYI